MKSGECDEVSWEGGEEGRENIRAVNSVPTVLGIDPSSCALTVLLAVVPLWRACFPSRVNIWYRCRI